MAPVEPLSPAVMDNIVFEGRSHIGRGNAPVNVSALWSLGVAGQWIMRAGLEGDPPLHDCNLNRQLDDCDITAGISLDSDLDGRSDVCVPICPADFDGDGIVGGGDLGQFLLTRNALNAAADLNGDDLVDGQDFGLFLVMWGPCKSR